ncbi:unnamed protein product, partial [Dibothriocephalus latus]
MKLWVYTRSIADPLASLELASNVGRMCVKGCIDLPGPMVTITSSLLLTYWCIVPLLLACTAWCRRRKQDTTTEQLVAEEPADLKMGRLFTDLLAVYGYSLTAFVPCS